MTAWTDFLREYSQKNGISYGKAMRDPEAQAMYKRSKGVIQVKRNVAQRGLADIASKAKNTAMERNRAMKSLKYRADDAKSSKGLPKDLLLRFAIIYNVSEYYRYYILEESSARTQKKKLNYTMLNNLETLGKLVKEMTRKLGFEKEMPSFDQFGDKQYITNEEMGFEEYSYKHNPKWSKDAEQITSDWVKSARELKKDIDKFR